jgi:hypothetical protein
MPSKAELPAKVFTIEQANAMLPLVRAITTDLARLATDVIERRQRLASFASRHKSSGKSADAKLADAKAADLYAEELASMQQAVAADSLQLQEYIDELRALGLEPKGAADGLVDFPSLLDGRLVYLCWKLGESEVTHWHEVDGGFACRQSLVAGALTSEDSADDDHSYDSSTDPDSPNQ